MGSETHEDSVAVPETSDPEPESLEPDQSLVVPASSDNPLQTNGERTIRDSIDDASHVSTGSAQPAPNTNAGFAQPATDTGFAQSGRENDRRYPQWE